MIFLGVFFFFHVLAGTPLPLELTHARVMSRDLRDISRNSAALVSMSLPVAPLLADSNDLRVVIHGFVFVFVLVLVLVLLLCDAV